MIKARLQRYQKIKYQIIAAQADYHEILSTLSLAAVDYSAVKVQTSLRDTYADTFARAEKAARRAQRLLSRLLDEREQIIALINKAPREDHRAVLTAHYIGGQTFDEIAADIGRSRRTVERIHARALRDLESVTKIDT